MSEQAPEVGADGAEIAPVLRAVDGSMPLVLVMVDSSPRQLQSIEWAVAALNADGKVELHGQETIWKAEPVADDEAAAVESFDSGSPVVPQVEVREQDGSRPDA